MDIGTKLQDVQAELSRPGAGGPELRPREEFGRSTFLVREPTKGTAAAERDLDAVGETLEAIDERFRNRPLLPHHD